MKTEKQKNYYLKYIEAQPTKCKNDLNVHGKCTMVQRVK